MHPSRRRKKRPNYGCRTVEVARGPNGFGFTISGQRPCILSCIVARSPADVAGLRAGDFLIGVDGARVSRVAHDAVASLIGKSVAPIRLTIAEHYYSDSSDDEPPPSGRAAAATRKHRSARRRAPPDEGGGGGPVEYRAIVGYLGTIEMPKQLPPHARLRTVNACVKKLRQEKRQPTAVLMTVLPTCLTLKNAANHILAIYPANRVVHVGAAADKDARYFGLVTSAVCDRSLEHVQKKCETSYLNVWDERGKCNTDQERSAVEVSNSCHVFVTDPKIVDHAVHSSKAEGFRIACTRDVITGHCLEFPRNALYIVALVQNMYRLQSAVDQEDPVANSPQPSASSNSDSGIGFRDDCGAVSDRILLVEFPVARPNNTSRPVSIIASCADLNNVRAMPAVAKTHDEDGDDDGDDVEEARRPRAFAERAVDVRGSLDDVSLHSARSLDADVFKAPPSALRKKKKRAADDDADGKLSPKVYPAGAGKARRGAGDEFGGSLRDLTLFGRRLVAFARSEPELRVARFDVSECEDNCTVKACADGPAAWATSFEELLKCPAGLHTFAAFLKKEFSAENIYFWTACERYRKIGAQPERVAEARRIFARHLRLGAAEAVNVDSQARQCVEARLRAVDAHIFVGAQKQIFNLMKFDSYTRFLKSDLYRRCLAGDAAVAEQQCDPCLSLHVPGARPQRSLSNAEDRRRRSLLPWHRKNRGAAKEAAPTQQQRDVNENVASRSASLTSLDVGLAANSDVGKVSDERVASGRHPLCRIKLANGASTMTQLKQDETIEDLVSRLLEKRGIVYSAFAVYTNKETKAVNVGESALKLAGCEVDVEQRVCFKLNLPNRKVIAVKSKSTKLLVDVLRPILEKYSYALERVAVACNDDAEANVHLQVTAYDNERIVVRSLEEITILHEKGAESSSVHSEDWARQPEQQPLVARLRASDGDDLLEGLNRAQRGRLDDQRGTKIDYAMPDFLKREQRGEPPPLPPKPKIVPIKPSNWQAHKKDCTYLDQPASSFV